MNYFRITKYDPKFRNDRGIYLNKEWTSVADVGKKINNRVITLKEYEQVELAYVNCYRRILQETNLKVLKIKELECYTQVYWRNNQYVWGDDFSRVIVDVLRERCWAKLEASEFYIHFGYDYYTYLGTNLSKAIVNEIVHQYHLFCEEEYSPYL